MLIAVISYNLLKNLYKLLYKIFNNNKYNYNLMIHIYKF